LETGGDQQRNCGKPVGKKMSQPGERFASQINEMNQINEIDEMTRQTRSTR
jgi:hypothetical protein